MSRRVPAIPPRVGANPIVAIVGRPNVGKSTLFNRIVGARLAIVEDQPGVTRDRNYADADLFGVQVTLVDTGGFDPEPGDPVTDLTRSQVQFAVDEADVIVCVFDGRAALTAPDFETVRLLRRSGKPVVFTANKVDGEKHEAGALEGYRVGVDELTLVSALHGRGVGDLVDCIVAALPPREDDDSDDGAAVAEPEAAVRVAVVGRPNAGKSSLINRLLQEERMLISDVPGTTRDPIDSLYRHEKGTFVLIDTAGLRKKRRVSSGPERHAVFAAVRALQRAHVAVLMIDADTGPAEQDAKIAGLALDRGCALVVASNKWDLVKGQGASRRVEESTRDVLSFAPYAPFVRVSAKTGRGVNVLMRTVGEIAIEHNRRVPTAELNKFFEELVLRKPPPMRGARPVKFYYVSQVAVRPPKIMVSCNYPDAVHFSYQRFVGNRIRERFGFHGTPMRLVFKGKGRKRP